MIKPQIFSWSSASIAAYWDVISDDEDLNQLYFTKKYASNIYFLASIFSSMHSGAHILDYGCGAGFLSYYLASKGHTLTALDFSEKSCKETLAKLSIFGKDSSVIHSSKFPSNLPNNQFDLVFSIEAYEHLLDEWIDGYVRELARVTKKNGIIIISTPWKEDLSKESCICPNCFSKFHKWGHLRSSSEGDLEKIFCDIGFETLFCGGIDLRWLNHNFTPNNESWVRLPMKDALKSLFNKVIYKTNQNNSQVKFLQFLKLKPGPHLFYIGRRI